MLLFNVILRFKWIPSPSAKKIKKKLKKKKSKKFFLKKKKLKIIFGTTVFANVFQAAQLDLQRRKKNAKRVRTMRMWKNALDKT